MSCVLCTSSSPRKWPRQPWSRGQCLDIVSTWRPSCVFFVCRSRQMTMTHQDHELRACMCPAAYATSTRTHGQDQFLWKFFILEISSEPKTGKSTWRFPGAVWSPIIYRVPKRHLENAKRFPRFLRLHDSKFKLNKISTRLLHQN